MHLENSLCLSKEAWQEVFRLVVPWEPLSGREAAVWVECHPGIMGPKTGGEGVFASLGALCT